MTDSAMNLPSGTQQALSRIEPMPATPTVESMLALAIERGATVETLERLMAIRREVRAEQAKESYDRAMAALQAECPTIEKTKSVKTDSGALAYKYAPIECIVAQVKELLKKHGFSYSTRMELLEKGVKAIVKVTHEAGHSEESPMEVPFGSKTKIMSDSQVAAAASTFAKRYAFCNAFGILTGDEDIDGRVEKQSGTSQTSQRKQPPLAARGTNAASAPVVASEEQRQRWINELRKRGEYALGYCYDKAWLLPPGKEFPGEPLETLDAKHVPVTKRQAAEILAELDALMPAETPQKPAGASSGGPSELELENAPEGEPEPAQGNPDGVETITGKLDFVSEKSGRSGKGPWTSYGVKVGDEWFNTFSKPLGECAKKDKGHTVRICFKRGDKSNDLVSIERAR